MILPSPTYPGGFEAPPSSSLIEKLEDHKACIWALGVTASGFNSNPDAEK